MHIEKTALTPTRPLKCYAVLSEGVQKVEGWVCEFPGEARRRARWLATDTKGRIMVCGSKDEAVTLLLEGLDEGYMPMGEWG